MRRFILLLLIGLLTAGLACNFSTSVPTPTAEPSTEPSSTPLRPAPSATPQASPSPEWGQICVLAYTDVDRNAMLDDGERPLSGVKFTLHKDGMEIKNYLSTDNSELYCFEELPAGDYVVEAATPDGFEATNPTSFTLQLNPNGRLPVILGFALVMNQMDGKIMMQQGDPALAVIGAHPGENTFYLISANAFQQTSDGGQNWQTIGERPPARNVVMSSADPALLLAGDGLDCFRGGPEVPMFRSQNGGSSWSELPAGVNLRPLALHPQDPQVAWAAGCDGLHSTQDGGDSWQHYPAEVWGLYSLQSLYPVPGQALYATANSEGGSGVVLRSEDGGQSWQRLTEGLEFWVSALLISPADPAQIWFTTPTGVWHSHDGGEIWSQSDAGLKAVVVGDDYQFEHKGLHALALHPNGTLYLGTEQGLYASNDDGAHFDQIDGILEDQVIDDLMIDRGGTLWITAEGGLFTWMPSTSD